MSCIEPRPRAKRAQPWRLEGPRMKTRRVNKTERPKGFVREDSERTSRGPPICRFGENVQRSRHKSSHREKAGWKGDKSGAQGSRRIERELRQGVPASTMPLENCGNPYPWAGPKREKA